MATFTRVVPIGQLTITRRELEQAGATDIDWTPAGEGCVRVTAPLPDSGWGASAALVVNLARPPIL